MMITSAQPSDNGVFSKVPSYNVTRLSSTVLANTSRIPALGSTALIWLISKAQSGWASNARVKIPVPAPILEASQPISSSASYLCPRTQQHSKETGAPLDSDVRTTKRPVGMTDVPFSSRVNSSDMSFCCNEEEAYLSYKSLVPCPNPL